MNSSVRRTLEKIAGLDQLGVFLPGLGTTKLIERLSRATISRGTSRTIKSTQAPKDTTSATVPVETQKEENHGTDIQTGGRPDVY